MFNVELQQTPILRSSKSVFATGVEDVWTPTWTFATPGDFSVTYGINQGKYFRLGSFVFAFFEVTSVTNGFDHTTAAGALRISGLPRRVLSTASGNAMSGGSLYFAGITNGVVAWTQYTPEAVAGETYIEIRASGSGVVNGVVSATDMPTNGTVRTIGFVVYTAEGIS